MSHILKLKSDSKNQFTNKLFVNLIEKNNKQFWNNCKRKFGKPSNNSLWVNGLSDANEIANSFAASFEKHCLPNNQSKSDDMQRKVKER